MKKIRVICFAMVFVLLFLSFSKVFSFKYGDGIYPLKLFYETEENSIDVICFGSSHVFENVNTGTLWDEYGIASFNLCGSMQPLWNTYYYMKEALKSQQPKVMVVDVFGAIQVEEYIDHSRIIKNNYGLKFSMDKVESVKVSSPKENWIEYLLEYPTYHNRYQELCSGDFRKYQGIANEQYWKGFGMNMATEAHIKPEWVQDIIEIGEIIPKVEKYLRKIIELSKKKDIPLLLIVAPYSLLEGHQKIYNRVAQIADEENVAFLNYNYYYDEIGLDFSTDFADKDHLNYKGNVKFTRYLADFLKKNYHIPDRRKDTAYKSYDLMADDCRQKIYNQEVRGISDIGMWLDKVQNDNYLVVYTIAGDYKELENYNEVKEKLKSIGIYLDGVQGANAWVIHKRNIIFQTFSQKEFLWHQDIGRGGSLMIKSASEENDMPLVSFNNIEYKKVNAGLNIFVYDVFTENLVESAGFCIENGKMLFSKR